MRKILIFYISKYSGHFHAASAIEKGLVEIYGASNLKIEKMNALGYTNPILEKIINKAYMEIIKKKPDFWGQIYDNPEVMRKTEKARSALYKFNTIKIKRLIENFSPDAIFCTQAFPCGMVAEYKRAYGAHMPLIGVLTDYAPHSYWLFDEVDYYVTPSEDIAYVLQQKGVSPQKIKPYGIPVDPKFRNKSDTSCIKKELELKDGSIKILIMGGTQGLGNIEMIAASLLSDDNSGNYQVLVVTGANKKLYANLKKRFKNNDDKLRVLSYMQNIDELMDASDIILTKAGGMTVAESLAKYLPMLIVDPIPGHERMNTDFLVQKGAAIEIKSYSQIPAKINELFKTGAIDNMRENSKKLAKPDSALDIAKLLF